MHFGVRQIAAAVSTAALIFCCSCEKHHLGEDPEVQKEHVDVGENGTAGERDEMSKQDYDLAIIGAGSDRKQIYQYTGRLMQALGDPAVVFPTHWDDFGIKPRAEALKQVATFTEEVHTASPKTKVIVPDYFVPTEFK